MRTANPTLSDKAFMGLPTTGEHMTLDGAVNKTIILVVLGFLSAAFTWQLTYSMPEVVLPGLIVSVIVGFVLAIVTVFKKEWSPYTAPVYALVEGVVLGALSAFAELMFPGIVIQAIAVTFGILFALLFIYKTRIIKVTQNFRLGVFAATGGIALIYLVNFGMSFFGSGIPLIHSSGTWGIIFSLVVVVIASMNLVLDFDFIERASQSNVPKYMEWYGAFGLMVTLVWLYIEVLRLLMKMRSRN
ncbi:MAG: Bax inhibitor-1/YccA family protein [Nanoarchaeota archaeon]